MPVDFVGNSLSTANKLNVTNVPNKFADWIGRSDPNDYYTINLSSRSSLNLALSGLSANADVQLLNSSGAVIAGSYGRRRSAESISTTLEQGTYYIRAYRVGGASTNYNLSVSVNEAPQSLQFSTDKSNYQVGETVKLTNTKVFDSNGVNDLARVDFRLQKDGGNWQIISDVKNFSADFSFNYSLSDLASGNYKLWAKAYDKSGANSNTWQTNFSVSSPSSNVSSPSSSVVNPGDWFDQNIQDTAIRAATRTRFADKVLDRNDMIAILREAKDNNVVDATELKDLRTLVSNASYLGTPEYVRVLSNKVVNGDAANKNYQGSTLGNLSAGSSDIQMENLINKWFMGGDRPTTTNSSYTYQYASGSLFQNGISYQDVKEGAINDCFLLAGLAETAFRSTSKIESMFIDNGDNTFSVRYWQNGVADYVTVDKYLPTNSAGYFVYASKGSYYNNSSNELWVALAEKAYAQLNESGGIYQDKDNPNSYKGLNSGGYVADAFAQLSGRKVSGTNSLNFTSIVDSFNSGQWVGLDTKSTGVASNLVANHGYALVGYNSLTQKFTLFNPWGINNGSSKPGIVELAWNEIETSFGYWNSTTTVST